MSVFRNHREEAEALYADDPEVSDSMRERIYEEADDADRRQREQDESDPDDFRAGLAWENSDL